MGIESVMDEVNPLAFISNNQIRNENGEVMEFKDHAFIIRPYKDMTPEQVIMKPSQIGWSVLGINKSLWMAKYMEANVVYTLPSKSVVKDFVMPKVDPIIMQNPVYQSWMGKTDSVALKAVGNRFVYFRGSWEEAVAISISAHILINDEVDRSNQKVLQIYRSRLDDAKRMRPDLGFVWQFSNPSIPGYGVDEKWQVSDKKHWFITCPHCNNKFYMKYPDNIDLKRGIYMCTKCGREIDNETRRTGEWVKKHLDKEVSGYWLSQMMIPWHSAKKIIADSKGDQQVFNNFTLGLPYISGDAGITRQNIIDCLAPGSNPMTDVCMGVDNGVVKTVVIGNVFGIFRVYETDDWQKVEDDIVRYNAYCVIDSNPFPTIPMKLAQKYHGKVFVHFFTQEQKDLQVIKWGSGEKQYTVTSDRTKIIDRVVSELQQKEIVFNMVGSELETYITHWLQLYRTVEENEKGMQRPVWKTIEGRADHFCFATTYFRIAMEKTFSGGGVVRPTIKKDNESVTISPEGTVPSIDTKDIIARLNKGRRGWKTR